MSKVTRHPNCRCATHVGDNPYCVIHGRIRNMDAGASPFVDADAMGAEIATALGIQEEDIDRNQPLDDVISQMHRDNLESEMQEHISTEARQPYDVEGTVEDDDD